MPGRRTWRGISSRRIVRPARTLKCHVYNLTRRGLISCAVTRAERVTSTRAAIVLNFAGLNLAPILGNPAPPARAPDLWDGRAARRIADILFEERDL